MVMESDEPLTTDDADATASAESEEQVVDTDPQAAMAARLESLESEIARLKSLDPSKIAPAIGRVSALQSELADIKKRDPLSDIDPRISATETVVATVAQALANSDLVDDRLRSELTRALSGLDEARNAREYAKRERELEAKITEKVLGTQRPQAVSDEQDEAVWLTATTEVARIADELGVSKDKIPWDDIQTAANFSPMTAVALATKWLHEHQSDPVANRVAERKKAAGAPSPQRSGVVSTDDDIMNRLTTSGIPMTDKESRQRAAARLGIPLEV